MGARRPVRREAEAHTDRISMGCIIYFDNLHEFFELPHGVLRANLVLHG